MRVKTKILLIISFLLISGCSSKRENPQEEPPKYDKEILSCLENELGGYLVTEQDELIDIPLGKIMKENQEKIEYYKGVYASNHENYLYVLVYPQNGTYEFDIMKNFASYFYEKFPVYQMFESPEFPTIYIHNPNNDVDFQKISSKCGKTKEKLTNSQIPESTLEKINSTTKITVKINQTELGNITTQENITKIVNTISSSTQDGDTFLCDAHGIELEMYDSQNYLIDTIHLWIDGQRLIPKSIEKTGCAYYSVSNNIDIRKIIEDETDSTFYQLFDMRNQSNQTATTLIYKENQKNYYLNSENPKEILIQFLIDKKTMTLQYALENQYISAQRVAKEYPDMLFEKGE